MARYECIGCGKTAVYEGDAPSWWTEHTAECAAREVTAYCEDCGRPLGKRPASDKAPVYCINCG
jgi:hypothetical protein